MPAVLFYLLDRHAPLAMTKVSKWITPYSLPTPPPVARGATPPRPHRVRWALDLTVIPESGDPTCIFVIPAKAGIH